MGAKAGGYSVFACLDRTVDLAIALTVACASSVMLVQVVLRYALNAPLVCAEELAVLAFGWMTFIGAPTRSGPGATSAWTPYAG